MYSIFPANIAVFQQFGRLPVENTKLGGKKSYQARILI
jgi:hypothetical protein